MRALMLSLALLAAPLAGCADTGQPSAGEGEVPAWSIEDTNGTTHTHETTAGSPTVVFYMATWCPSCQQMTEEMRQVHDEHGETIDMLSAGVDPGESEEDLERWKDEHDQPWPHGLDEGAEMQQAHGIESQSSVVVLDPEGHVAEKWGYGEATAEEVGNVIEAVG